MSYDKYLNKENPLVTMNIKGFGVIQLELFPDVAPNTVNNFVKLVQEQYYDGLIFHRIIPDFMIQGGWGKKETCPIKGEFSSNGHENPLKHSRGVISMARTNDPNSQTSQFFIMHQNSPHLDGSYAGFGGVVGGIEVVDKIVSQSRDYHDRPYDNITMESVTIDLKGQKYPEPVCYKAAL